MDYNNCTTRLSTNLAEYTAFALVLTNRLVSISSGARQKFGLYLTINSKKFFSILNKY